MKDVTTYEEVENIRNLVPKLSNLLYSIIPKYREKL